jgi:P4 family phage/plasmid primase-like protien
MHFHNAHHNSNTPTQPSQKKVSMSATKHSKQYSTLESFLNANRASGSDTITHTSLTGGKYNIPLEESKQFHNLMAKTCFADQMAVSIVERHGESGPVVVDLDIEYTTDTNAPHTRVYYGDSIETFLRLLVSAIMQYVDVPDDRKTRLIYVFEKSSPTLKAVTDDGCANWKDGLHIMLPNIITSPDVQKLIRKLVLADFEDVMQDYREHGYTMNNEPKDIYDESVIERNGWMLYGCRKPEKDPYTFTQIWHADCDTLHCYTASEVESYQEIMKELNMWETGRHKKYMGDNAGGTLFLNQISIRGYDKRHEFKYTDSYENAKAMEEQKRRKEQLLSKKKDPNITFCEDEDDLDFVIGLVDCLSVSRADNYAEWVQLGWCLHNIHNYDDTLLTKWISFSQQSSKYSDIESQDECEKKWAEAREDPNRPKLQIGSLCKWAKEDNPSQFKKTQQILLNGLVEACCNQYMPYMAPETDDKGNVVVKKSRPANWDTVTYYLVEVLCKKYRDELVCSSFTNKIWWEYKNHRWTDNTIGLRNVLSVDVYDMFESYALEKSKLLEGMSETHPRKADTERLRDASRGIAQNCRNTLSKDKTIKEALERFYWGYRAQDKLHEKPFEQSLDQNLYLIGLENGVYDLNTHTFRQGYSEDYISRNTGNVYYEPDDGWNDPIVKDIMNFFSQVLPDKSIREYVLTLFGSFCDGKIQEKFHIFVGCGGNGKSKLIDLFTNAMGQSGDGGGYCGNLPVTALTGKRPGSNAPTPEFERLKGMRFVVVQEPDQKESMQVGRLKELTGGDTIQARALHKEPIEFKPQFGMVMASNVLPTIPGDDGGVWRRMRVVRFESRFKENPDPNDPHEFPIDLNLSEKLESWASAFFWILMRYYQVFRNGDYGEVPILQYEEGEKRVSSGLRKCVFVTQETDRYRSRNDKFNTFITMNVNNNPTDATNAKLSMDILWTRYKAWCTELNVKPVAEDLQDAMEIRFDVIQQTTGFRGWKKICLWSEMEMDNRAKEDEEKDADVGTGGD